MKTKSLLLLFLISTFSLSNLYSQSSSSFSVTKTYHIQSSGGWDYLAVNPDNNFLYVSHGTQVNILNRNTGDSVGFIPNTTGVHGIAFANSFNKGFVSCGKLNNVAVFDLNTNKVIDSIKTGDNPDAIMFDAFSKKIFTCNGHSKNLSVIDASNDKVVATITLDGKPETAVSDDAGKLYVNIEDKSEIAVVDLSSFKIISTWSIAPGESPSGLAIDKKTRRLFAGCDNQLMIVVNADNGKIVDTLPIKDGCDGTAFDNGLQYAYASCGEGFLTVVKEVSADKFQVIDNIATKKSARTLAVDQATHNIFLSAADMQPNADPNKRPSMVAGTFQVLVVEKK